MLITMEAHLKKVGGGVEKRIAVLFFIPEIHLSIYLSKE